MYVPGTAGGIERSLVWVDRQGREEQIPAPTRSYSWVRVSPDGTRLSMEVQDRANTDIWIYDLARRTSTRLTFAPEADRYPVWTPDGQRVAYTSGSDIVWKPPDGTGDIERLLTGLNAPRPFSWSGDGKKLIYDVGGASGDVAVLSLDGERRPQALIETEFGTARPAMSPDDRWLAYQSNESGPYQIHVQPFPEVGGGRWQISTDGGLNPVFSPNGRELFYDTGNALMVVPIDTKTTFSPGTPQVLFQGAYFYGPTGAGGRAYDIAPDGQRFLMLKNAGAGGSLSASIIVVENWFEELRQRVPTR